MFAFRLQFRDGNMVILHQSHTTSLHSAIISGRLHVSQLKPLCRQSCDRDILKGNSTLKILLSICEVYKRCYPLVPFIPHCEKGVQSSLIFLAADRGQAGHIPWRKRRAIPETVPGAVCTNSIHLYREHPYFLSNFYSNDRLFIINEWIESFMGLCYEDMKQET